MRAHQVDPSLGTFYKTADLYTLKIQGCGRQIRQKHHYRWKETKVRSDNLNAIKDPGLEPGSG